MPIAAVLKELKSFVRAAFHLYQGRGRPFAKYGVNPKRLTPAQLQQRPVILIHGQGHNQSAWIDLAALLEESEEVGPLFTFNYSGVDEGLLRLRIRMAQVAAKYHDEGVEEVEFILVGHSLGAIVAGFYMFCESQVSGTRVHSLISVAGRLSNIKFRFWRLCSRLGRRLELLQENIVRHKVSTIAAKRDWLVPQAAVHVGSQAFTVEKASHLSVLHARETLIYLRDQLVLREKLHQTLRDFARSFSCDS
ncbi:MAG: alpha/beta hydrolase [Verrucomicrobia bacterium]|nr:alpha/beta hydrolase [Verrucomicrobiota bacterium]